MTPEKSPISQDSLYFFERERYRQGIVFLVVVFIVALLAIVSSFGQTVDSKEADYNKVVEACSYNPYTDECQYELQRAKILENSPR